MGLSDWLNALLKAQGKKPEAPKTPGVPPTTPPAPGATVPPAPTGTPPPPVAQPPTSTPVPVINTTFRVIPPATQAPAPKPPPVWFPGAAPGPMPAPPTPGPAASGPPAGTDVKKFALNHFAPISEAELKAGAARISLWSSPWFGRTDTIPPADDARTNLIDRALVTNGLLTPEQLQEIHEIGDLYREHRPDIAAAHSQASAAVTLDKAEREKRKADKKAAAKARLAAHAAAVLARRASDIMFLGRGVSHGLADRRADIEKLQAAKLPLLAGPADIAAFFGLTIPRLRWLAFHAEASSVSHYVFFTVPKKTGGVRRLSAPHRDMAAAQRKIFQEILPRLPLHDAAHGFVPTRSIVTNAKPHVGAAVVVNLDLKDFFPSVTFPRIRGILAAVGYSPCAATILALLCSECPREIIGVGGEKLFVASGPRALPQGACTSPALANLAARFLDARLAGLATAWGWTYTRYADDLTFSFKPSTTAKDADIGQLLGAVRNVVHDEGFTVNEQKTAIQRRSQAQEVTGLVVNERPKAKRELIRRLRAILHRAQTEGLAAQNRENRPDFPAWIRGMIAFIAMTDRTAAARLSAALDKVS